MEGLKIALDFIDEVISHYPFVKRSTAGKTQFDGTVRSFRIQATAIVQMQLGRLSGLERQKIEDELAALKAKIAHLLEVLGDEQ